MPKRVPERVPSARASSAAAPAHRGRFPQTQKNSRQCNQPKQQAKTRHPVIRMLGARREVGLLIECGAREMDKSRGKQDEKEA